MLHIALLTLISLAPDLEKNSSLTPTPSTNNMTAKQTRYNDDNDASAEEYEHNESDDNENDDDDDDDNYGSP